MNRKSGGNTLARETLFLTFQKDGKTLRHKWVVKKGIRGSRDANKVRKLQAKWGDPILIEGSGHVATLLRKEYEIYNKDKENYAGVSTKDILSVGAEVTGVPVKKLQKLSRKIRSKLKIHE